MTYLYELARPHVVRVTMSMRRKVPEPTSSKLAVAAPTPIASAASIQVGTEAPVLTMDDLTTEEQKVAMLDAEQATKLVALPWMNAKHCNELVRANMLSDELAGGILAFQQVKEKNLEQGIHD